jgi:hypothetical protein
MARLPGFRDLTKDQRELLTKGFAYSKLGVLGVTYQRGPDLYSGRFSQARPAGSQVDIVARGRTEVKYPGGLISAKVKSGGLLNYSADYALAPDLTLKGEFAVSTLADTQAVNPTLSLTYNLDHTKLKFAYNPKAFVGILMVGRPDLGVGFDGKFDTRTFKLSSYYLAAWSSNAERTVVLHHNSNTASLENLTMSYFAKLSSTTHFGAELKFNFPKSEGSLEMGARHSPCADLTCRAKANSAGLIGLAFTKQFNQHLAFTLGTRVDLNSPNKHQFGFKVDLKNE